MTNAKYKQDRAIYPAVFAHAKDGITVTFPDLPGCISCAQSDAEAIDMARDALGCWIAENEELGNNIPAPSAVTSIKTKSNEAVYIVDVWLPIYREQRVSGSVKKNVTIPVWLAAVADKAKLNYSKLLQAALKSYLGLPE